MKITPPGVGFACLLALLGCGSEPEAAPEVVRPIKILKVGSGSSGSGLEFPGKVAAAQNAEMAFEVSGRIIEFPVDESQRVEQGEIIARLDPRDFQSALDSERARLNVAEADFGRAKVLFEKDVLSRQNFDKAQRNFEMAQAAYATVEKSLEDSELRAPFAGIVAKKLVDDFQNVKAKEAVVILQDDASLEIEVDVPEVDFAAMQPGLSIEQRNRNTISEVTISSLPDRRLPAKIKEFSTTADPVTRTFKVSFAFASPKDVLIRPGMTAKVSVRARGDSTRASKISIPARAVRSDQGGEPFVWVVDSQTLQVQRRVVSLGDYSGPLVGIESGLEAGTEIAITGVHHLVDGMTVRRFEK